MLVSGCIEDLLAASGHFSRRGDLIESRLMLIDVKRRERCDRRDELWKEERYGGLWNVFDTWEDENEGVNCLLIDAF